MRPLLLKEFRALFPMWIASIAGIGLYVLTGNDRIQEMAILAYVLGSLALGAQVIGHEHSYRTMAVLLAQPIDRRRLLLTKLAVLAPMLVSLSAAAWFGILREFVEPKPHPALVFLPALGGMFVAPWLTMLTRNQLGGIMVTGTVGGWSLITTSLLTMKFSGLEPDPAEQLGIEIWTRIMYGVAAIGAVLTWRTFMRLEAIDGGGTQIHLPRWFRAAKGARRGHPVWVLVKKELRLQQLTFVMAGLFVFGEMVRSILERKGLVPPGAAVGDALLSIYVGAVAIVAGSLASAGERQYGMLESQQLLPTSANAQWAIKAGLTVMVALVLGLGAPVILTLAGRGPNPLPRLSDAGFAVVVIAVLTACSLYVSSLSSSGVRALAMVFPFLVGAFLLLQWIAALTSGLGMAVIPLALLFGALLLFYAAANHRTGDRSVSRVAWQLASLAAIIVVGFPLLNF